MTPILESRGIISLAQRFGGQNPARGEIYDVEDFEQADMLEVSPSCVPTDGAVRWRAIEDRSDRERATAFARKLVASHEERRLVRDLRDLAMECAYPKELGCFEEMNVGFDKANKVCALRAKLTILHQYQHELADESPYCGRRFWIRIDLSKNYPFNAPRVFFETAIYHFAVEQCAYLGMACLPILQQGEWSPAITLKRILKEIELFVVDPSSLIVDPLMYAKSVKLAESFLGFGSFAAWKMPWVFSAQSAYNADAENFLEANKVERVSGVGRTGNHEADGEREGDDSEAARGVAEEQERSQKLTRQAEWHHQDLCLSSPPGTFLRNPREEGNPFQFKGRAPVGWPYSSHQPDLRRVWLGGGTSHEPDALIQHAREEFYLRLILLPIIFPLVILQNIIKKISWWCLIMRSVDKLGFVHIGDIEDRFAELFNQFRDCVLAISYGIAYVINPFLSFCEWVFTSIFFALDLSNVVEQLFKHISFPGIPDAKVTCEGTKQPIAS